MVDSGILPPEGFSAWLEILGLGFIAAGIVLFLFTIFILKFKPRVFLSSLKSRYLNASAKVSLKATYNRKLNDLSKRYKNGLVLEDDCYTQLSVILRNFVSEKEEIDSGNWTLRDMVETQNASKGFKALVEVFTNIYGSEFGFSREEFSAEDALLRSRKLINKWR